MVFFFWNSINFCLLIDYLNSLLSVLCLLKSIKLYLKFFVEDLTFETSFF